MTTDPELAAALRDRDRKVAALIWEEAAKIAETTPPFDAGANVSPMDRLERMMCDRMRERIAAALRKQIRR